MKVEYALVSAEQAGTAAHRTLRTTFSIELKADDSIIDRRITFCTDVHEGSLDKAIDMAFNRVRTFIRGYLRNLEGGKA
jgi:hypothetical protein